MMPPEPRRPIEDRLAARFARWPEPSRSLGRLFLALHRRLLRIQGEVRALRADVQRALEQREYRGTWKAGDEYRAGQLVTHGGTLWHCNTTGTSDKPGTSGGWTLMVKSTR